MRALLSLPLLTLPLLTGCSLLGLTPPQNGQPSSSPASEAAEAPAAPAPPAGPASEATKNDAPAGPTLVSISLKNNCKEKVRLFFGDKPKFGSGTYSSLGSNTRTSKQMQAGDMIWIVDESDNGVASFTVSEGSRDVEITDGCSGWKG